MLYVGGKKAAICKGDFHPAALFKGNNKIAGYTVKEIEGIGIAILEHCYNDKVYNLQISENVESVSVRGKNYFDLAKVPFSNNTTEPYKNGLKAERTSGDNRGNKIPITLPVGKTIYTSMDVVDSKISGSAARVTMGFYTKGGSAIITQNITATKAHKTYSFTLSKEVNYIQFYFQSDTNKNAVGDYVTMDNIMLRTEGEDVFESYVKPRTILLVNGKPSEEIPTFKGTTVIEIDTTAQINGTYKKME